MAGGKTVAAGDISIGTIRKVRNRLIPLLFLLYLVAFLDRTNISFAALTMNADLAITRTQFGLLTGIFFWGYCLFEIPSNLLLHRIAQTQAHSIRSNRFSFGFFTKRCKTPS